MNKNNKVKVGVSWLGSVEETESNKDIKPFMEAIELAGGEPIYLNQIHNEEEAIQELSRIDALVMSGGEDINPAIYGEEKSPFCKKINEPRDLSDCLLLSTAIKKDIPVLAVCRGMQLLNVLCGGTLYQDLPTEHQTDITHRDPEGLQFVCHSITVDNNNLLADALGKPGNYEVNSWHHQGIKQVGNNLKVIARAKDGIVEAIQLTTAKYIYGVQFHPERLVKDGSEEFLSLFKNFLY